MDFSISNSQKEIVDEVILLARKELNNPDSLDHFDRDLWNKAAEFGLFGLNISEEYGGLGESYLTAALVYEALGYACINNGLVFAFTNHVWVALNMIYLYGSEYLKKKYLADMIAGEKIGCFALTEAGAGSDALGMSTTAKEVSEGYLINGNKIFISNGSIADIFVVIAKTSDKPDNYTAFVVDKDYKGVSIGPEIEKMGLNSCPICELIIKDCVVPKENVLGRYQEGTYIMNAALEWERCYEFAPHVGAMRRIMETCFHHIENRTQFGRKLNEFQGVTHKIADMKMNLEFAKLMLHKVAYKKDHGGNAFLDASMFKLFISEKYLDACMDAMHLFGAYGYSCEYPLEREMRDALACGIYSGTSEIQRNTIFQLANMEYRYLR